MNTAVGVAESCDCVGLRHKQDIYLSPVLLQSRGRARVKRGVFVFILSFFHLIFSHSCMGTFWQPETQRNTHSSAHKANMEPVGSRPSGEKVKCLLRLCFTRRLLCGIQALCIYIVCVCVCVCVFLCVCLLAFKVLII